MDKWITPSVAREGFGVSCGKSILDESDRNPNHGRNGLIPCFFPNFSWRCRFCAPGAESCIITRWHSDEDSTASWQARMYRGEDFAEASKRYHELFQRLKGCYLKLVDGSVFYLTGDWEPAAEEAPFTTSTLRVQTGDERYREVKVEVELVYLVTEWAVHVNIVSKKRDDQVGGSEVTR
ncbi:MAG TPA: hypothetical protein VGM89_09160 [Puia sp.]